MATGPNYNLIYPPYGGGSSGSGTTTFPLDGTNGSAATPTYGFSATPGVGVYYTGTTLNFAVSGVDSIQIGNDSLSSRPFYGFNATPVSGQMITAKSNGTVAATTFLQVYRANNTPLFAIEDNGEIYGYGIVNLDVNGTAANPAFLCGQNVNCGIYSPSGYNLAFSSYGKLAGNVATTLQWSAVQVATKSLTANYNVTTTDSLSVFDNNGSSATVVNFTLPSTASAPGMMFTFCDIVTTAGSGISITPQSVDTIAYSTKTAGQAITSPTATRSSVVLVASSTNNWAVVSMLGTFT